MKKVKLIFFVLVICFLFSPFLTSRAEQNYICAVYFTGVGCPHCAETDPFIFENILKEYPNFTVIEYEIFQQKENASLLYEYHSKYQSGLGVPLIIFNKNQSLIGDKEIIKNLRKIIENSSFYQCPLIDGFSIDFKDLDFSSLPGLPKIWQKNRILIKTGQEGDSQILKKIFESEDLTQTLKEVEFRKTEPIKVSLSGKSLIFNQAIKIKDWIFQWQEPKINLDDLLKEKPSQPQISEEKERTKSGLTIFKVLSLALADSINPCEIAVLALILITILTADPKNKKRVLFVGLAFTAAVFVIYFIYGLLIIKFFQILSALSVVKLYLYKILGLIAIILGTLHLKDFIKYKPGGLATEMPFSFRSKVKGIISRIVSPGGAFLLGFLVTIFLLPCTIGPYVICAGILCTLDLFKTLPWLLIYNLVFVLPMLIITFIIYAGFTKIEDVSGWKDKNIKYLHLIAGLIIFILGLIIIFGLI